MILALILVPLASLLWGTTNYIDKYLISKITKNGDYKGLIVFSSLIAGLILLPISAVLTKLNINIDLVSFIYVFFSSTVYIITSALYFKALNRDDTSLVIAMFQLIPVFSYFLGLIFLTEILSIKQIIGGLIVIISAILMTFEFGKMKFDKSKIITLSIMALSSFLYAVYFLLFRFATLNHSFEKITFWYQIGLFLNGLIIFLLLKSYRHSFIDLIKSNGKKVFSYNILNESLNLTANLLVNYAITFAPLAIVLTLNGLQPFFVFFIGIILTLTIPKIIKEDIRKNTLLQKALCIIGSIIGLAILYM